MTNKKAKPNVKFQVTCASKGEVTHVYTESAENFADFLRETADIIEGKAQGFATQTLQMTIVRGSYQELVYHIKQKI